MTEKKNIGYRIQCYNLQYCVRTIFKSKERTTQIVNSKLINNQQQQKLDSIKDNRLNILTIHIK